MDFGKPGENGLRIQGSWIPTTPVKPILPRPPPIYTEGQGTQLNQGIWLGSETFSSSLTQDSQVSRMVACCESPNCTEVNRGVGNCNDASAGNPAVEFPMDGMARWNNLPFADLLALADAASAASGNAALQGNEGAANGSFMSVSFCEDENNGVHSNLWPNDYCMPENHDYEFPTLYQHTYDLNLPPRTMSDAISSKTIPQLAPTTPAKDMRVGKKQVSEVQNLCANELSDEEREKQEKEVAATLVDASDFLHNTELQNPVADSSFAAVSTPLNENHNPDKGDSHVIDLNSTPQQKPRRKKHRPKVVIEGKPKRTPKLAGSKENPTGKRKYVRKKGVNKPSTTPPAEVTGESTDLKTLEPTKKSCRRSLNFDTEGPPQDESSTCKSSINLDSELQAQDFCSKGVQSRSTVQLGKGIEVTVQHTEAGIAYDLSCSMNQVLKDYMLLPERQAPGTPCRTKTNPPQAKESAVSQKENTEGKGQLSGHSGQENATNIMLNANTKTSPRSPNDSNCSSSEIMSKGEQARGSKRKHSHAADQAGPSTPNLDGVHCNILQEYDMMSLVHFPQIYKKKRTEKGQSSTTSNSSCVTAAKNFMRLATTYPQSDAKANPRSSKANHWISAPQFNAGTVSSTFEAGKDNQNNLQTSECMLALKQTGRSTKKRSKGPTRVRDLTSLTRMSKCNMQATHPTKLSLVDGNGQPVENPHKPHTCMDALFAVMHATLARKKRTKKRNCLVSSASSSTNEMQLQQKLVLYNHHLSSSKLLGAPSELILAKMYSVDEIVEHFKHLDINKEGSKFAHQQQNANVSYNLQNQEHNALVIYKRDGTVVPFEGLFNPIKKRRPRPKVDLDEETNRVWKLLLGNINSEGIDGTDEEKAKWWEEERRVFRGRADSFIARMHLVQGDRRFSQWKGSVLDSVIGVFLTQNVSDHLSSSAFMSLAARFPLKSRSNHKPCYEERTSLVVNEPEVCILDPEDSIQWNGKNSNSPVCDQSSMTLHDNEHNEEKAVNSNETSSGSSNGAGTASYTEGDKIAINDTVSSQNSVSSSQNSGNSSPAQTTEKLGSYSESNSEADNLFDRSKPKSSDGSASIVKFLQMARSAMLDEVHNHGSDGMPSDWNTNESCNQYKGVDHDNQRQNINNLDGPQSSLGASVNPSSNYPFNLTPAAGILEVECSEIFREKSRSADISRNKDEHSMSKQSALTIESSSQATVQNKLTVDVQKAARSSGESCNSIQVDDNMIISSQSSAIGNPKIVESLAQVHNIEMQQSLPNLSGETQDVIQKTAESDLNAHGYLFSKEVSEMNAATVKSKSKRVGKEKKAEIDWDILRKQAKANGRKRERTANTMDSLDWEAVRCADVKDIANAIKERGMNNMLAERIQDFLNRMVREHGSIDLEWLRDVPPDQAKEYLLSVRGLGLKSVECVRLLTLHQLAFPVDTNVGRIAVRLGWVPLQPLPESLQLHLLELYPVLESIQKYLWPRLCKLDQRTLYELHYQMITFGKVFCTKSKPNCNSCPMRGECRHFASAFASARLALPGPEERSIVSATENMPADQNPAVIINRLPLPQPQETKQSEENQKSEVAKSGVSYCEPIIEEPATPEPECTQIAENDIEDTFFEDPDEIPTIKLNIEEFTQNLQNYMQNNMALQEGDMSKALVALTPEVASIPMPKLKNVSRLRTEHQVYELPDSHPLLKGLDKREPDDPCSYLLAIWTPGETANSIQPPEIRCSYQDYGKLCDEKECFSCNSIREANSPTVRGTLLIPCRTAMRGSFPLNGTYFQVNEVFADHDSSLNPIDVPRDWIWNLPRRTVYFGTSIPTIFKGLTTEGIQHCFWRGYVCVRGFDQKNRAPRPLMARLHFPASKLMRTKGKAGDN